MVGIFEANCVGQILNILVTIGFGAWASFVLSHVVVRAHLIKILCIMLWHLCGFWYLLDICKNVLV